MPRTSRKKSKTGIYHIMMRGINRQDIFEDNEDRDRFIQTVAAYKEKNDFKIYGYCLMNNHIHLLIQDDNLAVTMRKICASYVYWYNGKHQRIGHLYQDRFKSEVVEKDSYFLTVLRYIHQNPLKAGIVKETADYKWSSYGEYLHRATLVDVDFALGMMAIEEFIKFNNTVNKDYCLEYEPITRMDDSEARQIIQDIAGIKDAYEVQYFERTQRDNIIREIKKVDKISIRQISRITGISYNTVRII